MKKEFGLVIEEGMLKIADICEESETHYKVRISNDKIKSVPKSKVAFDVATNALKRANRLKNKDLAK